MGHYKCWFNVRSLDDEIPIVLIRVKLKQGGEQHNENIQINVSDDIDKFELANSSKKTTDMEVQLYAYDRVAPVMNDRVFL